LQAKPGFTAEAAGTVFPIERFGEYSSFNSTGAATLCLASIKDVAEKSDRKALP
jgi:hypothetical protein